MQRLASSGFNSLAVRQSAIHAALNAGLREGVIIQLQSNTSLTFDQVTASVAELACHPNFGGRTFDASPVNPLDETRVRELTQIRRAVQHDASHMLPILPAGSVKDAERLSDATGIPTSSIVDVVNALAHLHRSPSAPLVQTTICDGLSPTAGSARFQGYGALAFGAKGLFHSAISRCSDTDMRIIRRMNQRISQWGQVLLEWNIFGIISSVPFKVPSVVPAKSAAVTQVLESFVSCSDRILVSVLRSAAYPNDGSTPNLFILNAGNSTSDEPELKSSLWCLAAG